jgi:pimeloyl-ACP methyl ester carboxylesterase
MRAHPPTRTLGEYVASRFREAASIGRACRDRLSSPGQLDARAAEFRCAFEEAVGKAPAIDKVPSSKPISSWKTGEIEVHNLLIGAREGDPIPANFLVPSEVQRAPAVLFLCGHARDGRLDETYRTRCLELAAAGFVVLTFDPPDQGERVWLGDDENHFACGESIEAHARLGIQCLQRGDHLLRYFLHGAASALCWLRAQPEVNADKVAVVGNSGGGMLSLVMGALDPSIAAVVPATFPCSFRAIQASGEPQDSEQIWPGLVGLGYEHADLANAICPRPLCILAAARDFFPIEGTRELIQETRRFYEVRDATANFAYYEEDCGHSFSCLMMQSAIGFLRKTFGAVAEAPVPPDPGVDMWKTGDQTRRNPVALLSFPTRPVASPSPCDELFCASIQCFTAQSILGCSCVSIEWTTNLGLRNSALRIEGSGSTGRVVVLCEGGGSVFASLGSKAEEILRSYNQIWIPSLSGHAEFTPPDTHPAFPADGFFNALHKTCEDLSMLGGEILDLRLQELAILGRIVADAEPVNLLGLGDWEILVKEACILFPQFWKACAEFSSSQLPAHPATARQWLRATRFISQHHHPVHS